MARQVVQRVVAVNVLQILLDMVEEEVVEVAVSAQEVAVQAATVITNMH